MAVAIAIGAFTEGAHIFFFAPLIVPIVVGSRELGFAGK
jgi:hypothetical protein